MSTLAQSVAAEIDFQSMAAHGLRTPPAVVLLQLGGCVILGRPSDRRETRFVVGLPWGGRNERAGDGRPRLVLLS